MQPQPQSPYPQPPAPIDDPRNYVNRELSWLDFNTRVLAEAQDPRLPLLERLRFIAITSSNLDEFYMVRVAGLKRQLAERVRAIHADALPPSEQLAAIRERTQRMTTAQVETLTRDLAPALAARGIRLVLPGTRLNRAERAACREYFQQQLYPLLTPLAVDPAHPFPYLSNLSVSLAVLLRDPDQPSPRFAQVKVPSALPRFFRIPDSATFVPLERIIAEHLTQLFPGMEILAHSEFRITRDADLDVDEDEPNLLSAIEQELRERRFGAIVRLEVATTMPQEIRAILQTELDIGHDDIQAVSGLLDCTGCAAVVDALERPDLSYPVFTPSTPPRLLTVHDSDTDIFTVLRRGDLLVHHPYESFAATTERFIEQAARDPRVVAIKQTLYRTSGDTPIIDALTQAAEEGKEVVVLVEITARFDEQNNIRWARQLERVGAHVAYGVAGLKTHAKLSLVVRQEDGGVRHYAHIGTGNYNALTARLYTDFGLLTCDADLTGEIAEVFNYLTGYSRKRDYHHLWVAPINIIEHFEEAVEREIVHHREGRPAGVTVKVNALADERAIRILYRAGAAGVPVRVLARGICALRPGIPGLSESITVRSVVGRFLEHSRVFVFTNGGQPEYYLGSADLLGRNLYRRVECVVPVRDPTAREELAAVLDAMWADRRQSWELQADASWRRRDAVTTEPGVQERLIRRARARPLVK
ncbi:MAG TPA: polyphosphate kinase 1 [Candidatus Dormibacteraeota bacterium]|nr:polyphosphate kinase 1 [Candidatus Dormibacteraeota bacterium]